MGILGFILSSIANLISTLAKALPTFNPDTSQLGISINYLNSCISVVNSVFPMDTVLQILSILCAFSIAMVSFYFIQRVINLLRGAG